MLNQFRKIQIVLFVLFILSAAFAGADDIINRIKDTPYAQREMRAVWVATVSNIDWPSKPGLPVEEQKKEAIAILDKVKELNMNAVVFQVRPQADAFYPSDLEPWSYFLTGEQGKAPEPFYDPLKFWIEESHTRGLELHAWFNPYRANHPSMKGEFSEKSIVKSHPEYVKTLGRSMMWMDPSIKAVQDQSFNVIMDVVKRYDVDGIHFDDYFYPYPDNNNKDFPDDESYKAYLEKGGKMNRGDWRRDAVNQFIKRVYYGIKKEKPYVKFGISPYGIYRPYYPVSIAVTFDQYISLYADAKLWWNKGWVDYYTPQLYWPISVPKTSYPVLLGWWASENKQKRNLWPGLYIKPGADKKDMALELVNQVMVTRGIVPDGPGNIFFSMKSLMSEDGEINNALTYGPYSTQALIPPSPWLDNKAPGAPSLNAVKENGELKISWNNTGKEKPMLYVLYTKNNGKWSYNIFPETTLQTSKKLEDSKISEIAISAVDRCGNESKKNVIQIE